jgi:tetratricopeptide (TPR) repeat protein
VGLSTVHCLQVRYTYLPINEGYTKARKEAEKALELNPNLADAYSQIATIKNIYEMDWTGADEAYKKALELEPENENVLSGAAHLASTLGRFDETIKLAHRVIEIDPVHLNGYFILGINTWRAGLPDESIGALRKCLELNPQFPVAHTFIGLNYLTKGKPNSALAEIQKEKELNWQTYGLAIVYYALSKNEEADNKLATLIKNFQDGLAYQIAEVYAYKNEKDKAFEWLERAYNQHDSGLTLLKGDPFLYNIRKDSRYAAFMKKMKLPL